MHTVEFAGCCTAKILTGLGQTDTAEWDFRPNGKLTVLQIKTQLGNELNKLKHRGDAVLTVTTNNEQVNANQALKECGFEHTRWMSKSHHPETKLRMWWFPLNHKDINA